MEFMPAGIMSAGRTLRGVISVVAEEAHQRSEKSRELFLISLRTAVSIEDVQFSHWET